MSQSPPLTKMVRRISPSKARRRKIETAIRKLPKDGVIPVEALCFVDGDDNKPVELSFLKRLWSNICGIRLPFLGLRKKREI